MANFRVYVNEHEDLLTDRGDYLREATEAEVAAASDNQEGFIQVPDDVRGKLVFDHNDGTTRVKTR